MRRLFSTFASGAPGAGLLLIRTVAGCALLVHAIVAARSAGPSLEMAAQLPAFTIGLLLLAGLWTPVAGVLAAVQATWIVFGESGDAAAWTLVGAIGIALSLLGPGVWSADARIFGWKRLDLRGRDEEGPPSD